MTEPAPTQDDIAIAQSGVVYGDIIYWGAIVGAVLTILGSIVTFTTTHNYIDPNYLLSAILEGRSVAEIWAGAEGVGSLPNGHWYLERLTTGNGLTMAGMALGVFSVIPGLLGASYILIAKEKMPLYGSLALIAALITIGAMFA